ncbi:MAG TPA: ELWxxDGT repeat protein [Thermoanaerobaculia bacterium]|jgi:ELWxxDGT repeat protein|nr:ELWxxDGT repeat protein [Thermoanaerobaculia bacterium]
MRRLALVLTLIAPLSVRAQTPYLVKDINASTTVNPSSSSPANFFRFGSRIFFSARTTVGTELWSTDGTAAGTALVADINVGSSSSNPSQFVNVNGRLLFNANDGVHGQELWTTDGTSAGTRLLADISNGSRGSTPGQRIVYHGQMIFSADDGIDGNELWITDGTPAGTRFLKDLSPGPSDSYPGSFVLFNDLVYFATLGGLWKTDGTAAGTVMVKQVDVNTTVTVAGSQLFFPVFDPQTNYNQPWVSDGTEAGTHMIMEFSPGPTTALKSGFTALGDRVLFLATDPQHGEEIWISDGTAAGTHILRDINPGPSDSVLYFPYIADAGGVAIVNGVAYFTANTAAEGQELWKTDGTEAGTTLVRDIFPGQSQGGSPNGSNPAGLVAVGDRVFFSAMTGVGRTLWVSDGTVAGTRQVTTTAVPSVSPNGLTNIDGIVYFAGANSLNGYELWKSDGTDAGTTMVANIAADSAPSSAPANLTAAGDWIYFNAWDGIGTVTSNGGVPRSLWRSDGTPEGTLKLTETTATAYVPAGRSIFFIEGTQLWMSDGTPEGTAPALEFVSRFPGTPSVLFGDGDKIFAAVGTSLWVTSASSHSPAVSLGAPAGFGFVDVAGRVMFFTDTGLWTSDGTPAGTYPVVADLGGRPTGSAAILDGYLYFGVPASGGMKLWKSDGSFDGTIVLASFPQVFFGLINIAAAGRNVFFNPNGQLWVTDGTPAGTQALPANITGPLAAAGKGVVFATFDATSSTGVWGSDGTVAGTHLLRDVNPALAFSPPEMVSVDGMAFFTAYDTVHGLEMWVSDGTPEGTKLLADVEPGIDSSIPQQYVRAGNHLFFTATTSATGNELWALPLSSGPRLTINDIRVPEGDSGTTAARFTVSLSAASAQTVTVDYATSDGTATAGSDYDAVSGTLTFAAGETSKNIDVPVRGDVIPENNETFLVTLRNASGAALAKASGFAIIDDDDQIADLALALDFSLWGQGDTLVNATNNGPRAATNMKILHTATPADAGANTCQILCSGPPPQLAPGATARALDYRWFNYQQYVTATATIHESDPQPANNSVGWIVNSNLAMDALYLTPGSQANVWIQPNTTTTTVTIAAIPPGVVSVPSTLTISQSTPVSFVVHGVSAGNATIAVLIPGTSAGTTLSVDVVNPGTKVRWPGAVNTFLQEGGTFDNPAAFTLTTVATAPYTGASATGLVTITENGQELGRATLTPGPGTQKVLVYLPALGLNSVRMDYAGDANFLPMTKTWDLSVFTGNASILAGAARTGTAATVHVRVTGSPAAAPTGTITISEPGVIPAQSIQLTAADSGSSQADFTLTNVSSGQHTLTVAYSGDAHYKAGTQSVRINDARVRSVRR